MKHTLILVVLLTVLLAVSCSTPSAPVERSPLTLSSALSVSALCGSNLAVELSSATCKSTEEWTTLVQKFCGESGFSGFTLLKPCMA